MCIPPCYLVTCDFFVLLPNFRFLVSFAPLNEYSALHDSKLQIEPSNVHLKILEKNRKFVEIKTVHQEIKET